MGVGVFQVVVVGPSGRVLLALRDSVPTLGMYDTRRMGRAHRLVRIVQPRLGCTFSISYRVYRYLRVGKLKSLLTHFLKNSVNLLIISDHISCQCLPKCG